ncbi:MAG: TonB-dependent receptor plug domain-containing protein [Deltaproteobacteria bacterium]|nr:TonB-dependent receptor plug domain-containing protein [Deltaproteobacteria bacterium]
MNARLCALVCVAMAVAIAASARIVRAGESSPNVTVAQAAGEKRKEATGKAKKEQPREVELGEVVVEAKKPMSAASSDEVRAHDYELRPHATTMEILNNIPGLVVAQHQGGGKAPQYLIRGFDADHGTDIAVSVDGLPVNMVTHAHGQGYADLNFLIPETVERFTLRKGPYFADVGDFANAAALNFVTKDEVPENFGHAEGGSFDTQRYVAVVSPHLSWGKNLTAAQAYFTNGPFVNDQHYARYNLFTKFTLDPTPDSKLQIAGGMYDGDWDGSGQIPRRVVQAGRLALEQNADATTPTRPFGRFDSIDPFEGGSSDRENINLQYSYTPNAEDQWTAQVYGTRYKLQLFSDFTFYKDTGLRFRDAQGNDLPGDGIEQNDSRLLYGGRVGYTRNWLVPATSILSDGVPMQSQIGLETRNDDIDVALHRQVQRRRFFTVNKLRVEERSLSGFVQQQVFFTDWIRLDAGLRGDVFFFDGHDRLPTQPDDLNFDATYIAGNAVHSIVSPKANLIITPVESTDIYLNFGNGFHSNDARNVLLAKANPEKANRITSALAKSTGYELGVRTRQFDKLDVAASLWLLDLSSELVFSGDAGNQQTGSIGNFEPSGPTRRWGIDFESRYQITEWLFADYDLSYADPRFRITGEAVALAPTLLMNSGLTVDLGNGFSGALRARYLGDRPAIEDRSLTARGYFLMDLLGKYRWRNIEASMALLNLTDTNWREAQFNDTSCVLGEVGQGNCLTNPGKQGNHNDPPADIHFTPGIPFGVRAGLTVYF